MKYTNVTISIPESEMHKFAQTVVEFVKERELDILFHYVEDNGMPVVRRIKNSGGDIELPFAF